MSPAKRTGSTLGPLGFIYPFFLVLQRVDWGVKFVRCLSCDRLTTSHTSFQSTKDLHVAFSWFTLSVFIFSTRQWSVMFEKDFWQELLSPSYKLKTFLKKTFTRECSPTSTRVIEAERTAFLIEFQEGDSCAAGDLELYLQNRSSKRRVNWVIDAQKLTARAVYHSIH